MKKLIFIVLSLITLSIQCNAQKLKECDLKINVKIRGKLYNKIQKEKKWYFYNISIDLINNSNTIISFWTMTCSWSDNWISNSKIVGLSIVEICDDNVPDVFKIEPGKKITYNSSLVTDDIIKAKKENNLKLGFILIKENEIKDYFEYENILKNKIKNKKDIIWSNTFKIPE